MANPQKGNGFTQIPNEIIDAFGRLHISGNQWRLLWAILRLTYGWNRESDHISLGTFERHTGLDRRNIKRCLDVLVSRKIIIRDPSHRVIQYGVQEDYTRWLTGGNINTGGRGRNDTGDGVKNDTNDSVNNDTETGVKNNTIGSVRNDTSDSVNNDTETSVNINTHQIKKDILKKGKRGDPPLFDLAGNKNKLIDSHFKKFFDAYPKKTAKRDARKAWGQIFCEASNSPYYFGELTDNLMTAILEAVKTQSQSLEWQQENGRFIPHPATWLRGHRWEDKSVEMRAPGGCGGGGVVL